jgi:hypothetical protein
MSKSCVDDLLGKINVIGNKTSASGEDENDSDDSFIDKGPVNGNEINPIG